MNVESDPVLLIVTRWIVNAFRGPGDPPAGPGMPMRPTQPSV